MTTQRLDQLAERQDIINTVTGYVIAADESDWDGIAEFFADEIVLDHVTSLAADTEASPPVPVPRDEMLGAWKALFEKFHSTQHQVTNFHVTFVEPHKAVSRSYVEALHVTREEINALRYHHVFGTYRHTLEKKNKRWVITDVCYRQKYAFGNPGVFGEH